ncbi:MAG TPA: S8 family serine peptidase [Blastocatellia bacterium]|nr:S8 family serine peptidase [Blastocatellia bacterium]
MTGDARFKSRADRGPSSFKFNQRPGALMILFALFAAALLVAAPASTQVSESARAQRTELYQGRQAVASEVLVKFRDSATRDGIGRAAQDADVELDEEIAGPGIRLFRSRSKDVATLIAELSARPDVAYAEPNYILFADLIPNDTSFGSLWGLRNTGQVIGGVAGTAGADISATPAWDITTGSRANVVGVVDTGLDYNHPDLAANVWSAPSAFTVTMGSTTINCPAGSHGFNAITNTCDPLDDNNHGTHCSGTIGAVGNNGVGVAGVNWTASIMGLKFLSASGSGSTANAIKAIEFAIQAKQIFGVDANVRVLSNSWGGGGFSQALLDEINKANTNDMLFAAAAGNNASNNDLTPFYPASYNAPNVMAVAATTNRDQLASFSNFGATSVDLGAPGSNILSTVIGNSYAFFSGTSMATPHVSGAAALVLSECPSLDTAALKSNLLANVDPLASLSGKVATGGRLNVNKALLGCGSAPAPDFSLSASPSSRTVAPGAGTSYGVTVTSSGGFTGTVTFSASGLPGGASASFTPASVAGSGSSTMNVTTDSTTPVGSYTLTITGTSGSLVHSASVTLVVANGDFSLSATPASRTVARRQSTTYTVTVTPTGGFSGTVGFTVSGLSGGATASFSPTSVNTSGSTTMTVTAGNGRGTSTLTITGTSGSLQHTTSVTLTVSK